ncbi:substrate-binding domain-containing protein [Christensenellaceae bacterium OttesenSCG-928-K19]|nr:substrate-binding domain-containing protein [Christensenellaceae bacterium OttesenSCG-928-K19]
MKFFRMVVFIACAVIFLTAAGCSSTGGSMPGDGEDLVVAFVPKLTGNAFFEAANEGAQEYASNQGFTVEYVGDPVADANNQIAVIESLIEQNVAAICISSLDATALDDVLKQAMQAGINIVTWDSDVSGDARSLMVSQGTPEQLGIMLVEMGAKSLASRGKNPTNEAIRYAWHYSQASVADQNSWQIAGEAYIDATYPNWVNVAPQNYYSEQDAEKSVAVGQQIFADHPDIDLIICNDSTALPGQAEAAKLLGLTERDITITGFASPNAVREYCEDGIVERWGLWDCQVQGALGCYLAWYLASGHAVAVGEKIDVPEIGVVEVMPNTVLDAAAYTSNDSGTVLLPSRLEFTKENVGDYNF